MIEYFLQFRSKLRFCCCLLSRHVESLSSRVCHVRMAEDEEGGVPEHPWEWLWEKSSNGIPTAASPVITLGMHQFSWWDEHKLELSWRMWNLAWDWSNVLITVQRGRHELPTCMKQTDKQTSRPHFLNSETWDGRWNAKFYFSLMPSYLWNIVVGKRQKCLHLTNEKCKCNSGPQILSIPNLCYILTPASLL